MLDGVQAPAKSANCDVSAIERNIALGSKLGVTGTPTVFVPSGQRAPGAVSIEYLENMLAKDKLSEGVGFSSLSFETRIFQISILRRDSGDQKISVD